MEKKTPNPDNISPGEGKERHLELIHSVEEIKPVGFEDGCFYLPGVGWTDSEGNTIPRPTSLIDRLGHWKELKELGITED